MNWGKGIIAVFILFAIFIGTLVTVCVRQDISLVSNTYYQDELAYQKQIERILNTERLPNKPAMRIADGQLEIHFIYSDTLQSGELKLFRPSDISMDKSFVLQSSENGVQHFDLSQLPAGMYKARMSWMMSGKEYYLENIINL